ncbi:MAG TPA: 50S ribosomal protein L16 [Candidatus Paceibacterota bacterium]|nr:50S ribosomal protein L16 [Candidatus Paceibacterota bacterium]
MLQPRRQKYRKQQKGRSRNRKKATRGTNIDFGSIGLQARSGAWITANQIEACRKAINHKLHREGKVWIRIFPDKPVTSFPPEIRMGKGKGEVDRYVAPVKPGQILFEIGGIEDDQAAEALRLAGHKLPIKVKILKKSEQLF